MDTVKRKTVIESILTVAIIILIGVLLPKETTDPANNEADEPSMTVDEIMTRYPARVVTDGTQVARDMYGLPCPSESTTDEIMQYAVKESSKIDDSFFDDAVFIGDNVTECLYKTVLRRRSKQSCLGRAQFFTSQSYGLYEATRSATSDRAIHPFYNNNMTTPSDLVRYTSAKKVYICLGLNDLSLYTTENCLKYYKTVIDSIREKSPDVVIYVQSVTPVTLYGETRLLYNAKIDIFNLALAQFADENGCRFLYISDLFKDTEGYLAYPLSSDDNRLLEREACALWIDYLYTHTGISE